MKGARALLAFRRDEREETLPEEPSEDALVGALMEAEYQGKMIDLHRGFFKLFGK